MSESFESESNKEASLGEKFAAYVTAHCKPVNMHESPYLEHMSGDYSLTLPFMFPLDEVRFRINSYLEGRDDEEEQYDCFNISILGHEEVVFSVEYLNAAASREANWFVSMGEIGDSEIEEGKEILAEQLLKYLVDFENEGLLISED